MLMPSTTDRDTRRGDRQPDDSALWGLVQNQQQRITAQEDRLGELERALMDRRPPRRRRSRWLILGAASVVAALGVTTGAVAGVPLKIPGAGGVIHGCYAKSTGILRVSDTGCSRGEKALTWNQRGQRGLKGDVGARGLKGDKGDKGDPGPQGPSGVGPQTFCVRCDKSNTDLSNQNLAGVYFPEANLRSTKLVNVKFDHADLRGADFTQTALSGGREGPQTDLTGATFRGASLQDADFDIVTAPSASFVDANLHGALVAGNFNKANFIRADLTNFNASGAYFQGAHFEDAIIEGINLQGAVIENASFAAARGTPSLLNGAVFANTTCPDGSNSNNDGNTCNGHWLP